MADDVDPGYESATERSGINNQSAQTKQAQKKYFLHPYNWARYFRWASPRRYFVAVMAFLGFYNVYATQVNLVVVMVGMVANSKENEDETVELTDFRDDSEFDWSSYTSAITVNSFYYGYILSQIPGAYLASIYGPKKVFGICVLTESFLMAPVVYSHNFYVFYGTRFIHGILQGVTFPSLYLILSKWAPASEKSKLATAVLSGGYFGTFVSLPLAFALERKFSWLIAVEFFSMIAATWAILWLFIVAESPKTDPYITEDELNYIQSSVECEFSRDKMPLQVPWKKMLCSLPVWAIIMAHFCQNYNFYTVLQEMNGATLIMFDYLVFEDFSGSLPYLSMGITVLLGGFLASFIKDRKWLTTIQIRKIFNCSSFLGRAIFLILAAQSNSKMWYIINMSIAFGFGGFAWSGFGVNHFDISPLYAGFLMALSNTFATLPAITNYPFGYWITNEMFGLGKDEYFLSTLYISSGLYIFGAIFYGVCASGEVQSWSRTETESRSNQNVENQITEDLPLNEIT